MANGSITRAPRPSSLADVLDLILDKGLVIDAYVRVSLVGIEILTIDARIVVASVDTYLHFAEAVSRLDLQATETSGIPELLGTSNGSDEDKGEDSGGDSKRTGSSGSARSRTRQGGSAPARELKRGGRSGAGAGQESGARRGALVGRLADRGRRED